MEDKILLADGTAAIKWSSNDIMLRDIAEIMEKYLC
jgi:hypothetical protein